MSDLQLSRVQLPPFRFPCGVLSRSLGLSLLNAGESVVPEAETVEDTERWESIITLVGCSLPLLNMIFSSAYGSFDAEEFPLRERMVRLSCCERHGEDNDAFDVLDDRDTAVILVRLDCTLAPL